MKLRNKKTGEIGYTAILRSKAIVVMDENAIQLGSYTSLAELNEEWEDYEEPKEYWYIADNGEIEQDTDDGDAYEERMKEIGNYFETEEEAELAVRKLKAWKRLKDKGFRFRWVDMQTGQIKYSFFLKKGQKFTRGDEDDLLLLFGGEE